MKTAQKALNYFFSFLGKTICIALLILLVTIAWKLEPAVFYWAAGAVLAMDGGVYLWDRFKKAQPGKRSANLSNLD
jgi:hypothetical protein